MKKSALIFILFSLIISAQEKKESILDRKVVIDTVLHMQIPPVPRFCDQIPLKKYKVNTGDCNLYVEEEGAGTPIVLINGGPGGTHHCFHPWFSEAAKHARVIYYDQRGCGLSDINPGKEGYSVDQALNDLDAIRKFLKIDKWIVFGYSYGGFLAQYYTTKHPENVSGLILLCASPNIELKSGFERLSFLSKEEKDRIAKIRKDLNALLKENKISYEDYIRILIYNNYLNGDWKRQHFLKPSPESIARKALYEWTTVQEFNSVMYNSAGRFDFTGAFNDNPIPTLILEGKWDCTWSVNKKNEIKANHPNSNMVVFENSGHPIYNEEPEKFFATLKNFIQNLKPVDPGKLNRYKDYLASWRKKLETSPGYLIKQLSWGIASSKKLTENYTREWLKSINNFSQFLRIGFALYDMNNYTEAFYVFEQMEIASSEKSRKAVAIIWQGHMLDLLGRRDEALKKYQYVADLNDEGSWSHGQYEITYQLSPYAKERLKTPFKKLENNSLD